MECNLEENNCSICIDRILELNKYCTPCNHVFHINCLTNWLVNSSKCPLCKEHIPKDENVLINYDGEIKDECNWESEVNNSDINLQEINSDINNIRLELIRSIIEIFVLEVSEYHQITSFTINNVIFNERDIINYINSYEVNDSEESDLEIEENNNLIHNNDELTSSSDDETEIEESIEQNNNLINDDYELISSSDDEIEESIEQNNNLINNNELTSSSDDETKIEELIEQNNKRKLDNDEDENYSKKSKIE